MSTAVFPSFPGLAFPVTRTNLWSTDVQTAVSGKEVRLAYWTYPKYQWEVDVNVLRSGGGFTELQTLMGFVNSRQGQFDSFLYQDADDYTVSAQTIGTGTGTQTSFQLIRTFGGFIEPVLAPNTGATFYVYLNGTLQSASNYTINPWGTSNSNGPGALIFNTAPGNGVAITATFSYYYPCRFMTDKMAFVLSYNQLYKVKKITWQSVKN